LLNIPGYEQSNTNYHTQDRKPGINHWSAEAKRRGIY